MRLIYLSFLLILSSAHALNVDPSGAYTNGELLKVNPDNYKDYAKGISTVGRHYVSTDGPDLKPGIEYQVAPNLPKLMLLRTSTDGISEMREIGGGARFFRTQVVNGKLEFTGVQPPANPHWQENPYSCLPPATEPDLTHVPNALKGDREKLVKMMVDDIGDASRTATTKDPAKLAEVARVNAQIENAVRFALDGLDKGEPMTVARLEKLHLILTKGTLHPEEENWAVGILRGSEPRDVIGDDGKTHHVDLRNLSLRPGNQNVMSYRPPHEVPAHMQQVLKNFNAIGPKSKPSEAASVYLDYLTTHPFIDGNGRVSRILMFMMQMKMGVKMDPIKMDAAFMGYNLTPVEFSGLVAGKGTCGSAGNSSPDATGSAK